MLHSDGACRCVIQCRFMSDSVGACCTVTTVRRGGRGADGGGGGREGEKIIVSHFMATCMTAIEQVKFCYSAVHI